MNTTLVSHAKITVPADCFELVSALVQRLGGQVVTDDNDVVTVPPMPESERVGRMLKGLRLREGMTQAELAPGYRRSPEPHFRIREEQASCSGSKGRGTRQLLHTVPGHFLKCPVAAMRQIFKRSGHG